jgi:obg-like ATPase 1
LHIFAYLGSLRRVAVPDARFDWLCDLYKPASKVPAYLTVIDIAGLVKGASSGAGLGNAFLSHIKAVDAIFHVCRTKSDTSLCH